MFREPTTPTLRVDEASRRDRLFSFLRSSHLDRQLTSGAPLDSGRSLAVRARYITGTEGRRTLAEDWERLLHACQRSVAVCTSRTPLCRDRILGAEAEIRGMLAALSEAGLESAAGVAAASLLLRDGTGPLYNRRSKTHLSSAIENVTRDIRSRTVVSLAKT
jgi:hypothetical protein